MKKVKHHNARTYRLLTAVQKLIKRYHSNNMTKPLHNIYFRNTADKFLLLKTIVCLLYSLNAISVKKNKLPLSAMFLIFSFQLKIGRKHIT